MKTVKKKIKAVKKSSNFKELFIGILHKLHRLHRLHIGLRFGLVLVVASVVLSAQQQQPTFKSGIEIFHLHVSVLDRQRQPVRGLTGADFTILEDGKPQKIVAFSQVDVPGAKERQT